MNKKPFRLMCVCCTLLVMTACDKHAEVKQFMTDLATAVATGDSAAITKMYPDAALADSLSLTFEAEKSKIEETGNGYRITTSDGDELMLVKNTSDGKLTVKESRGVFEYSAAAKSFGLKTGLLNDGMNDATIAKQLADSAFANYVSSEFINTFKKSLRIASNYFESGGSDGSGGGEEHVTLRNDGDIDIAGSDYMVVITSNVQRGKVHTIEGMDIFAKSTLTLVSAYIEEEFTFFETDAFYSVEPTVTIKFKLTDMELLGKYFHPKGDEYENYLKTKK